MKEQSRAEPLAWTGERLVTTCRRPLIYEHLHRYGIACALAKGQRVLDIACGEGYGASLLARVASEVTGVDIDRDTIAHAKDAYRHRNLNFLEGSCTEIPCVDQSIDLIASFETIEHIREHGRFLQEIKRVLTPGGILVISSPHKAEYRKMSAEGNPFHEVELNHDEFVQLIADSFKEVVVGKQRLVLGSWIAPDAPSAKVSAATFRGGFDGIDIERGVYRGLYSIAVCSDQTLPVFDLGLFENFEESADAWNLLDSFDTPAQISAELGKLAQTSAEGERRVEQLQRDFDEKSNHVALLQLEHEEKARQVAHFQREHGEQAQMLERLKMQIEDKDERLARAAAEFLDARWEVLTLRGRLVRETGSANRLQDLQNQIEASTSERDQLRGMVTSLQVELATTQDQLRIASQDLCSQRKEMQLPGEHVSREADSWFGRSQRKLQQLMAKGPEHD